MTRDGTRDGIRDRFGGREMYVFLMVLAVAATASLQGWRTLYNNFAEGVALLDGGQIGVIQSVREIPGFLALGAVYVLLVLREHTLAALSVLVLGVGVAMTGFFPSFTGLALTTLVMSFGFHYYETMNQSLTLQYFDLREAPRMLGRVKSVQAMTNIVVGGMIIALSQVLDFVPLFCMFGAVALAAGAWALLRDPSSARVPPQGRKLVFRRRYWLFYALTFLAGSRRQIFVAFAVFLLVEKFHYPVMAVAALFVANNVINAVANPLLARAVNRFGERKVLSLEYAGLAIVFAGYAVVEDPWLAGALYVADNLLFNFAMAVRTFFQKIADTGDIASGMAVGFTVNHVAAVVVPALGGLLWLVDYRWVFAFAAVLSLASLALVQRIDIHLRRAAADQDARAR